MILHKTNNTLRYNSDFIIKSGDFSYRINPFWAKIPGELGGISIVTGCSDQNDNLYFCSRDQRAPILKFNNDGTLEKIISNPETKFDRPHGISLGNGERTILLVDDFAHVVYELDLSGNIIRTFGNYMKPSDTGYDFDIVQHWREQGVISKDAVFDHDQTFAAQMNSIQRIGKPFNRPTHMIQAEDGTYFAADGYGNAVIHCFAPDGTWQYSWGGPGSQPGEFHTPHCLCFDSLGRIWVADRENYRVQVFDRTGELLAIVGNFDLRVAAVWTDGKYMYLGEVGGLSIVNMDFEVIAQFGYYGSQLMGHGMCGDSQGNLYFSSISFSNSFGTPKKVSNVIKLEKLWK